MATYTQTPGILEAPVVPKSKGRIVVNWITSTDHKTIGYMYLIASFVFFCFGGVMALELARSDVLLRAAVGFHPGFATSGAAESARITASVQMICGAEDAVVSADDRRQFENEMRQAHVADWRLEVYGGVGHSFTNPDIASRGLPGLFAYDERADRRSWVSMLTLLDEVLV